MNLESRARIQRAAELTGERRLPHRRRLRQRAVTANERPAIPCDRSRRLARIGERNAMGILLGVDISREHSPCRRVELRDDVEVLAVARRAEHPLVIGEDAQGSDLITVVGDRE